MVSILGYTHFYKKGGMKMDPNRQLFEILQKIKSLNDNTLVTGEYSDPTQAEIDRSELQDQLFYLSGWIERKGFVPSVRLVLKGFLEKNFND